jgi:predicted metal-binding membrane protein
MQHRYLAAPRGPLYGFTPSAGIVVGAWVIVVASAVTGQGGVIHHAELIQGGLPLWVATLLFLAGWQVMLWAMMIPTSLHAIEARQGSHGRTFFVSGYLTVWTGFGLLAFLFDVGVHATVAHSPWLAFHPWIIAGATLVLAGTYQLSRLKDRSLEACRMLGPGTDVQAADHGNAAVAGIGYGAKCVGASWALMLLAFALGAGSLACMVAITAVMAWEVTPWGASTVRITGYGLIVIGVFILAGPIQGLPLWAG